MAFSIETQVFPLMSNIGNRIHLLSCLSRVADPSCPIEDFLILHSHLCHGLLNDFESFGLVLRREVFPFASDMLLARTK